MNDRGLKIEVEPDRDGRYQVVQGHHQLQAAIYAGDREIRVWDRAERRELLLHVLDRKNQWLL